MTVLEWVHGRLLGRAFLMSSGAVVRDQTTPQDIAETIKTAKTIVTDMIASEELPYLCAAWFCRFMTKPTALHPWPPLSRSISVLPPTGTHSSLQERAHLAGHAAVAVALGQQTPSAACPRPERLCGLPDLPSFRRDLAVLVAGLAADLVVGDGRATPAGARDLLAAIQYAFDMLVRGSHWPADLPPDGPFTRLSSVLAVTIINRTFNETERAVAAATRILVAGPIGMDRSGHGA
jgi:hypothetical protein